MPDFVHLHTHTEYSPFDGMARTPFPKFFYQRVVLSLAKKIENRKFDKKTVLTYTIASKGHCAKQLIRE